MVRVAVGSKGLLFWTERPTSGEQSVNAITGPGFGWISASSIAADTSAEPVRGWLDGVAYPLPATHHR